MWYPGTTAINLFSTVYGAHDGVLTEFSNVPVMRAYDFFCTAGTVSLSGDSLARTICSGRPALRTMSCTPFASRSLTDVPFKLITLSSRQRPSRAAKPG